MVEYHEDPSREKLLAIGEKLRDGGRTRVHASCGPGRVVLVSRAGGRITGWCFRCNRSTEPVSLHQGIADNVLRVRQALTQAADAEFDGSEEKPAPLEYDSAKWPPVARLWLLQAGIWGERLSILGAGWHEELQRVVMPLTDAENRERSWTARSVDGRMPKYLTGRLPDDFVAEAGALRSAYSATPIIVEDWLSAAKLGMLGHRTICMLGTYPKAATLAKILQFKEVYVWLDNDLPPKFPKNNGQIMARRLARTLRAYGLRVNNIASDRDPKLLDSVGIKRWIVHSAVDRTA